MTSARTYILRLVSGISGMLAVVACLSLSANGQDLLVPSPSAPPPLKFISSTERAQLSTANDAKSRLKTSILMAETRLLRAEQFTVDRLFIAATSELGVYQAIIEDALAYLGKEKKDSNKTRDLFKRLEIQLRLHSTRIESMRRVTPVAYALHVKNAWKFSDNARVNALNGFFSDIVLPQNAGSNQRSPKRRTLQEFQQVLTNKQP